MVLNLIHKAKRIAMNENVLASIRAKWKGGVTHGVAGFTPVPDLLIRSQGRLKLTCVEMMVLVNLLLHWWEDGRWPYPRISLISEHMGTSRRTVERAISVLHERGLVVRVPSEQIGKGPRVRPFNLDGLVQTVKVIADEREGRNRDGADLGSIW